ncbi:virulence factor SrfB [Methylobacter psychrophilus]|uniref:virulence factor SrfB n=1 Tax=Methylobacter psychrophilus TaxID=96941 RepID=UPI0021D4C806|nr:virulence factor SrfB [Methylobacter psychrophilus]
MRTNNLPKYSDLVSLIPGGTIQFLDLGLDTRKLPRLKTEYWEWRDESFDGGIDHCWHLMCLKIDDRTGKYIDQHTRCIAVEPTHLSNQAGKGKEIVPSYSLNVDRALEPFLGQWTPLPFLRKEVMAGAQEASYRKGPCDWARVLIIALPENEEGRPTHSITIAFDTVVEKQYDLDEDEDSFAALRLQDVRDGAEFSLVADIQHNSWFIAQEWVSEWLKELFIQALRKKRPGRIIEEQDFEHQVEHMARYISFLEVLNIAEILPSVRLIDPARNDAIDVDLVLDIGNSRTTGMLIERRIGQSMGLSNSAILELRDLTNPNLRHKDPFGSNVAFVRMKFGDPNGFSRGSGRRRGALQWPSVLRVGPEASRIALHSRRDVGQTTMSSPKRYLWDRAKRVQEWRYCPESEEGSAEEPPVNSGAFVGFVNNYGTPLHVLSDPRIIRDPIYRDQDKYPVTEPMFSRSSIMMFLLCEVISHALAQINAPSQRGERLNPDLARRLRNIILTVPPAMTIAERQIFERWANWAVETLWKTLDWASESYIGTYFEYQSPPVVRCQWDEASTTQMVYVYNEIAERFAGDATEYFSAFGRIRPDRGTRKSYRVASIDIGGGTTDLMVTTYIDESQGSTAILEPIQEFREGFNLAGDDILKAVIERHLLKPLVQELKSLGMRDAEEFMTRRVGSDYAGLPERDRNLRAQFAQQYAVSVGLHILKLAEQVPITNTSGTVEQIEYLDVFSSNNLPRAEVLAYIDDEVSNKGVKNFSLVSWINHIDLGEVSVTINSVVSPILKDLCESVAAWNCDVLLLSGRPSCLPAVKAAVLRHPPVPSSRIIAMNSYRIESWYPFWSLGGVISDPKTTNVVGAMLCALSEGDLLNFHCNTSKLKPASTVKYVGEMQSTGQIRNENLFFSGIDLDANASEEQKATFKFGAPMFIGFRQLPLERWTATPFYFLSFSTQEAKENARKKGLPYTISLLYKRTAIQSGDSMEEAIYDEGAFKIEEIISSDGSSIRPDDLHLELRTLRDEYGHWLDTGLFDIQ